MEFELLEQQFLEIIGDYRTLTVSECRLRDAVRTEATRAEAAEAACAAAQRKVAEAHNTAAAATAGASRAASELASVHEQATGLKIQLEIAERQKAIFEEKYSEISSHYNSLEREVQQLRPLQSTQAALQRQYTELQERIVSVTEDSRREASRLEAELRRVEKCAAGGAEIRERARLAAAAHAREKRLLAAELQHTTRELTAANVEISRLSSLVERLQICVARDGTSKSQAPVDPDHESLAEVRAALQAERAGAEILEQALASALSVNATLAAEIGVKEMTQSQARAPTPPNSITTNINCPIDSFLAE